MRAFVIATFVALMGYGIPTLAQQSAGQITAQTGMASSAKSADVVRTRSSYSSATVSEVYGRR